MKFITLLLSIFLLVSCSEKKKTNESIFEAGFKTIHAIDSTRIYKPKTNATDYLHYRPLDIDIWYPAKSAPTDSALLFRDILGLLELRANYYTASDAGKGISRQIAQSLCDGLKCSDTARLLNFRTKSVKNASPIEGKFPLVVYICAYNGMSFENFDLFEKLAAKGFVVVSISSIGRYPGDMTMKKEDLLEQVNDAVVALHILKASPNIDFSKTGIVGYSWGGLAGAVLAAEISNVACFVSLEGSEFHHYGEAKDENADFNGIRYSEEFKSMQISAPYLRLESAPLPGPDKEDSVYNFSEKITGEKSIFTIDSTQHENFSCLPAIVSESGHCNTHQYFSTIPALIISFLEKHLKNEDSFSEIVQGELNKSIKKK